MARPRSEITAAVLQQLSAARAALTWRTVADELVGMGVIGTAPAEFELVRIAIRNACQRGEIVPAGAVRGAGRTRPPMAYRMPRPGETTRAQRTDAAERGRAVQQMLLAWG